MVNYYRMNKILEEEETIERSLEEETSFAESEGNRVFNERLKHTEEIYSNSVNWIRRNKMKCKHEDGTEVFMKYFNKNCELNSLGLRCIECKEEVQ